MTEEVMEQATGDAVLNPLLGGYNFVEEHVALAEVELARQDSLAVQPRDVTVIDGSIQR